MTKAACINTFIPESKLCQPSDVKPCDSAIISTPGSNMAARKTPDVTNIACVYFFTDVHYGSGNKPMALSQGLIILDWNSKLLSGINVLVHRISNWMSTVHWQSNLTDV